MNWLDSISTSQFSIPFVGIISLAGLKCENTYWPCFRQRYFFSSNVHFYTSYILSVNYVLPQTRACKNFENRMNTKKVIDIHDYDFTLKDLVGYNKLVWSVGDLFPGPEIILLAWTKCENTSLPCFRQRHFFLQTHIFTHVIAYLYSTCYREHVHVKNMQI